MSPTNSSSSGRVEVQYHGTWGTICAHRWDLQDAGVVCRQLGYNGALSAPRLIEYEGEKGLVWLDRMQCEGKESSISQCSHVRWGEVNSNCWYYHAGVVCRRPKGKFLMIPTSYLNYFTLLRDIRWILTLGRLQNTWYDCFHPKCMKFYMI